MTDKSTTSNASKREVIVLAREERVLLPLYRERKPDPVPVTLDRK